MMSDLIKRLEALEAPCREYDCLIGVAVGWFVTEPNKGWPDRLDYIDVRNECWYYPGGGFDQLVPRFTVSIDAAMTLVPEVLRRQVYTGYADGVIAWAGIAGSDKKYAKELPIAICIAALRAQEASHDGL
jgi:hypothetical protein